MGLATLLLPIIPNLISGIMSVIDTIRNHPDTPAGVSQQLADISAQLDATAAKVAAIQPV